jgi:hypothetical protein
MAAEFQVAGKGVTEPKGEVFAYELTLANYDTGNGYSVRGTVAKPGGVSIAVKTGGIRALVDQADANTMGRMHAKSVAEAGE